MKDSFEIVRFYQLDSSAPEGRTLESIWQMSDEELMTTCDVIQVLLPLVEPSAFNPDAPLLTPANIELFRRSRELRDNLLTSFHRFLKVFGLHYQYGVVHGDGGSWVFASPNHNWLRFSRIIKSLTVLRLPAEAKALLLFLEHNVNEPGESLRFWREAAE